jgi:cell wall assembly regulator SMI1
MPRQTPQERHLRSVYPTLETVELRGVMGYTEQTSTFEAELATHGSSRAWRAHALTKTLGQWLERNHPSWWRGLRSGATDASLTAAEAKIGARFPADLRASLKVHDGGLHFWEYEGVSAEGIASGWQMLREVAQEKNWASLEPHDPNHGEIGPGWWTPGLLGFAGDSGGNEYSVDVLPGPAGVYGRMARYERGSGAGIERQVCFADWLHEYVAGLMAGDYRSSETFGVERAAHEPPRRVPYPP